MLVKVLWVCVGIGLDPNPGMLVGVIAAGVIVGISLVVGVDTGLEACVAWGVDTLVFVAVVKLEVDVG